MQAKAQCSFFGNLRSHVFTLKSFVSLFVFLFICLFIKHVVLCVFSIGRRDPGASCTKVGVGLEWSGGSGATSDHMFHQHTAARSRQGEESSFVLNTPSMQLQHFPHESTSCLSCRLLSDCFPQCLHVKWVEVARHWWVGAARGRKAPLSETLRAVVAHRGPVVETSNQPTDQHKKLDESISQHYFQRKTVPAQDRPLYGSIMHGP